MTTSIIRRQPKTPVRRDVAVDTGAINIGLPPIVDLSVALPQRSGIADVTAAPRRFLARLLDRRRSRSVPTTARQLRHDAVYRADEGGSGDDGGWS